ncbi:MAG: PQQ-binding-like beta-propeller repeat protein [Acidobacteria bacterium]|nr:PQQ-binding-like beta-propeller repeat protein [Acidobacteriota bacterium]
MLRKRLHPSCFAAMTQLLVLCASVSAQPAWVSSGIGDIDAIRRRVAASPTSTAEARERQASLYSWLRLLMHQGAELRAFEAIRRALGANWTEATPRICRTIDEGFQVLERVQASPSWIPEVRGTRPASTPARTDWPLFQGNQAQTGFTRDPGPAAGRLAWRFPIGHTWYARPSIENGRVYAASPGITTILYCLDEKTGKPIWKTRQHNWQIYETPRVSSPVVVLKDELVVRESGSRGETGTARDLVFIDKQTGQVRKEVTIGHLDYRHGYAPVSGNDRYIVYPYGQQYIENVPPLVWNLDTVVCKDPRTGQTLWAFRVGDISGDVVVEDDRVFVATDAGVLYSLNLAGPERIAWQYRAGGPIRGTPRVTPAAVLFGANDGVIHALDRATGRLQWSYRTNAYEERAHQFFSTPEAAAGRVYVGAADQFLYCLDERTGRLVWRHRLSDWIRAKPVVIGGVVYIATLDGTVAALAGEGSAPRELWSRKVTAHQILADLTASATGLLVGASDLFLCSLDPLHGQVRWRHSLLEASSADGERVLADLVAGGADYQSSPTTAAGRVYAGGPNRFVYAVDSETGQEIWRFETSGQVSGTPIVAEGRVYFGQQGGDKNFYAVDAANGRLIWKKPLGWAWVGAGYAKGRLFVGTVEGDIHCVRAADGEILWTRHTTGGVYPSPATDGQTVYTGAWGGHYYALDAETGDIRWAYYLPRGPHPFSQRAVISPDSGAPLLWNGRLIVAVGPAALALDAATGKRLWEYALPPGLGFNVSPATDGERVYVSTKIDINGGNLGARVIALDALTCKLAWEHQPGGGMTAAAVTPSRVCFGSSTDPFFSCVDPKGNGDGTTRLLWRYKTGGIVEESCPAIYGNKVYFLSTHGYLYALE